MSVTAPSTAMITSLFTLTALAASVAAQITVDTPTDALSAIQCEVYGITWTGGTGPFDVRVLNAERQPLEVVMNAALASPVQWIVNQTAESVCLFRIQDAAGVSATSNLFTVQAGSSPNSTCLFAASISSSSAASTAPASATVSTASSAYFSPSPSSSSADPNPSSASPSPNKSLSAGEIAGIAVGAACGMLLAAVGVAWTLRRSRPAAPAVSELPYEEATSVEPFPLSRPGVQPLGSSRTGSNTPDGWERKNRRNEGTGMTADGTVMPALEGVVTPGSPPSSSAETAMPSSGELGETTLDRLVNPVLRRLQAQEAPPSYPASSHPGSDD